MSDARIPAALGRRSFLRNSAFALTAAAAGSTLLTACGSDATTQAGSGAKKVTFLSILPLETLSLAPELLGVAGGYFAKHGLDVTLQPVKGSAQAVQTLLAGVAPITRLGSIDVMTALVDATQPMVNIGTLSRGSSLRFIYSKKNHQLTKPEDFLGQTMGVPSEGGTSDKVVSLVLASAGLDPKKCKRQVVGLTPGTFNLVQQRRLAGYVVSIDTATILLSQSDDVGVFNPGEYVKSDGIVYVTTRDAMKENRQVLTAFMAAIHEATSAIVNDTSLDETIKQMRTKYSFATLDDDKIAKASLKDSIGSWTGGDPSKPLLITDKEAWLTGYKELTDAGMAKPGADAATWFDNGLLPKT